jgi:transposase
MEPIFNFVEMFERSIGLKEPWEVVRAEFDARERAVHVYVEGKKTAKYPCPQCGKMSKRYDDEEEERVWRHADVVMYPCYIHSRRPRVQCAEHGIHVVDAPWARRDARQTLLFEGYAMMLAEMMTLNEARRVLRVSRTALLHIVQYWVEKAVREADLSGVRQLSIDETSFKCGQSYVTVIGDPNRRRVIGVEAGMDIDAVERFSLDFLARGGDCNEITHVSMDMSATYQKACELCFPRARLVFDHFHVKQLVMVGMDEVRRDEQGKKFARSKSAGRKLLMIPEKRMTPQQVTAKEALCQEYPKTGRAFRMVQQLDDLYRSRTSGEAESALRKLTSWMMHSRLSPMKKVARSLRRHKTEILEYFQNRLTNAFAEAMNSLIQAAKRKARGFRTFQGFRTMIFLAVGKLHLSYPYPFFLNFSRS